MSGPAIYEKLPRIDDTVYGTVLDADERSLLFKQKKKVVSVLLAILVLAMALSYFGRPRPPLLELVSPRQELPDYEETLPGDTALAKRVTESYGLAMVLVQSPYTQKNVVALESLRTWAKDRFQRQPDFLHPISLANADESRTGFVEATCYNLFAGVRYWAEGAIGGVLQEKIAAFHETNAYVSFRNAYFDLFGLSNDSAILLARYQTERAKQAIDVLLVTLFGSTFVAYSLFYIFSKRPRARFDAAQKVLASGWLITGLLYLIGACSQNQLTLLVSAFVAIAFGAYLRKPFTVFSEQGAMRFRFVTLTFDWVALAYLLSYSLLCIQVLTWIRMGSISDPITLLLASLNGNFLQEQIHAKRLITQIVGISWIAVFGWTMTQLTGDAKAASETEESLGRL